ncbi:substrate-binding periplasmic protein [Chrysiogenes arsenatis]|uniref:substrate-binding periplasmic protein n=1 Tax=Chrysiogenes arsenatis TaxID=309797 RepID=UPI000684F1F3|nr:ABC transporter substrate-binding protein [Chrysiogenes arsenatis]
MLRALMVILAIISCFFGTSLASSRDLPPDMQRIFDRGTLRVGMYHADIAPFFMQSNNGELTGIDVDLAHHVAQELGVELELVRTAKTFDALVEMLEKREVDVVISELSRTLKRARTVRFTRPYIVLRQGLLLNRVAAVRAQSTTGFEWIFTSAGPVGVKAGTSYVGYAQANFPNAEIRTYPEWEEVVDACVRGEVLFAYHDEIEVKKIIRDNPAIAIQLQTAIISDMTDPIAMAVPWQSTHLLAWLEQYIDAFPVRMDIDTLLRKYYEQ